MNIRKKRATGPRPAARSRWVVFVFVAPGVAFSWLLFTGTINWIMPFLMSVTAVGALFTSQPTRPRLAAGTSLILLLLGVAQTYKEYTADKTKAEFRRIAADKLSGGTHRFLRMHSELVVRSSDGWLPSTEDELFSSRVAKMICSELDVFQDMSVSPKMSLLEWMAQSSETFEKEISEVLREYRDDLDPHLIRVISDTRDGYCLRIAKMRLEIAALDRSRGGVRVPLLCPGLEPLVAKSLADLRELKQYVLQLEKEFQIQRNRDWAQFPERYRKRFQGRNYFGPSEMQSWRAANPNGFTDPFIFGSEDPRKSF